MQTWHETGDEQPMRASSPIDGRKIVGAATGVSDYA